MSRDSKVINIFKESGALLDGHFILRSGLRSRQFFQCAQVCQYMDKVTALASWMVEKLEPYRFDTVLAPAMGGLVIGQEVARQTNSRYLFVEKVEDRLALRRNFQIKEGERVLVVEDVVTRGGRAREAIDIVLAHKAIPVALAVIVDRSDGELDLEIPYLPLLSLAIETFSQDDLPEDLQQIPPVKPGS